MVCTSVATDDALVETLDVEGCEALPPKLYTTLPPHLVLELGCLGVVVSFVVLAVDILRITRLGKFSKELFATGQVLHTCSLNLDELHLLHTHQRNGNFPYLILLVKDAILGAELDIQTTITILVDLSKTVKQFGSGLILMTRIGFQQTQQLTGFLFGGQGVGTERQPALFAEIAVRNRAIEMLVNDLRGTESCSISRDIVT